MTSPPPRRDVRMDGVYFCRSTATAPFARSLEPGNYSYCVMVRSGRLRLETDFPAHLQIDLAAGDAVAISGLAPHVFRSPEPGSSEAPELFAQLPMPGPGRGPEAEVELVVGVAPSENLALGSLTLGPVVVRAKEHPDLSRRLWTAVSMLEDEYADASWIDRDLVVRRLAEIMAINVVRCAFAGSREEADGAGASASRFVMQAISAVLRAPDQAWTLAELARASGMSRTRFAQEFKQVTGQTPGRIVSRLRLTGVARRLAADALSVEAAAEEAGYSSAAAFVRAFHREFGETPARWRRRRAVESSGRAVAPASTARRTTRSSDTTRSERDAP